MHADEREQRGGLLARRVQPGRHLSAESALGRVLDGVAGAQQLQSQAQPTGERSVHTAVVREADGQELSKSHHQLESLGQLQPRHEH